MDALHRACLFIAGACLVDHHAHRSLGRVHPLRAQQRGVMAGADGRAADDRAVVPVGRRVLSRVPAYRRRHPAGAACRSGRKAILGWILEICMLATNLFMLLWGIKLVQTTWYQSIAELPAHLGRHVVSADPDRRRDHLAVRDRAVPDAEFFAGAGARNRRRSRPSSCKQHEKAESHGRPHPGRQLRRAVPRRACRSPMRSGSPPSSPRCGSACRSKPSCSRCPAA